MSKYVRAFFRGEDGPGANITMDVLINDQRRMVRGVQFYGYWGKTQIGEVWPFVYRDGQLDFGNYTEEPSTDADRFATIDLEDRIMAVGENFNVDYQGDVWPAKLERLTDVTELKPG